METKICVFEESQITFQLSKDNGMMINATEMAKVFGKQVNEFMSNERTISFVNECLYNGNSRYININSESELFRTSQKSGTYMHRILALKFAAWLSPKFELWVFSTIEKLLFGKHVEREQSFERTMSFRNEMDKLVAMPTKTTSDFDRYIELEKLLRYEVSFRSSLTKESLSEMKDMFSECDN